LDVEARRYLTVISSNVVKMDRLITDLLALARISRGFAGAGKSEMNSLVQSIYDTIATTEDRER